MGVRRSASICPFLFANGQASLLSIVMYGCMLTVHANIGSSIQVFVHQLLVLHRQFQVCCSVTSVCVLCVYQFRLLGGGKLIPCLSHGGSRWHNEGVKNIIAALLQNINIGSTIWQ